MGVREPEELGVPQLLSELLPLWDWLAVKEALRVEDTDWLPEVLSVLLPEEHTEAEADREPVRLPEALLDCEGEAE